MIPGLLAASLLTATPAGTGPDVDFARDVRPILARRCFACHGNDEESRGADLRLDIRDQAVAERGGFPAIVPGDLGASELWVRVTDDVDPMPPEHAGDMLEADELQTLRDWIEAGAPYADHWAFEAPVRHDVPQVPGGAAHPIDAFIERALARRGLTRSARADDATLLRRLSLDLTGLAPTSTEARELAEGGLELDLDATVARLLESPASSERWAAVWLDLARYADSAGHGSDPLRTIWRYRDWVIEAFDANMPFDEFTVQQLAGDLLPDAGTDERLATAFHRNTMTNTEGGTDDEEFRVLAVKDRVNTTMQVWMGLTAGCAECHSHKYDPISHHEYYELYDIFNQTADTDRADEAPTLETPSAEQLAEHERIAAGILDIDRRLADLDERGGPDAAESRAILEAERRDRARFRRAQAGELEVDVGEVARRLEDGSWFVESSRTEAVRRVVVPAGDRAVTLIGIEALADPALPGRGPGRNSASGNFVLTHLVARALPAAGAVGLQARRVRVELPGPNRILSLAEVEILGADGEPLQVRGTASQSSTAYDGDAGRAFDGNTSGAFSDGSVTHTATEESPWWELELDAPARVGGVRLWTRTDGRLASRLHGVRVVLGGEENAEVWRSAPSPSFRASMVTGPALGEPLQLEAVAATHEQPGFGARRATDAVLSDRDGWAVAGGEGKAQLAVYRLPELGAPCDLELTLEHRWGSEHVLGRFAVVVADDTGDVPLLLAEDARAALGRAPAERTMGEREILRVALARTDAGRRALEAERADLDAQRRALAVVRTPVMEELSADQRRKSHVLVRGNFLQPAEQVHAAVPAALGALPDGVTPDRMALARWLVSPENPLTARVAVNRVWARLFGRGLVATEEDFGTQGELPSHPELLDWLAVEFMESGWDHRALLRLIVSSETYRQASAQDAEARALDPDCRWLSRYPRQRLEAEMVRDGALRAAGLLSSKRMGPSVFPPQPDGLWQAAFNGERTWTESTGEDRYRRGLYVFLRRTIPYPMLNAFDAPSREMCTVRRIPTNTPLQAFVTLNDPVFVEAAQALGRVLLGVEQKRGVEGAVEELLWRVTSRPPDPVQAAILTELLEASAGEFRSDEGAARTFAEQPLGPLEAGADAARAAAWTLVASTGLNMDAALMKE